MPIPKWTLPYDRTYSDNPPLGSCEYIAEKHDFEPYMCPYTYLGEYYKLFAFKHLPLSVATLMHLHNLKLRVSSTILDGHKNPFWITGEVPPQDCGKTVDLDKDSGIHGKGYLSQVLCAGLATYHLQGGVPTSEHKMEHREPNFKPYSMSMSCNGNHAEVYFRFQGQIILMAIDDVLTYDGRSKRPRIHLSDGSSPSNGYLGAFDGGQPLFVAIQFASWHPPYQLRKPLLSQRQFYNTF